MFCRNAGVRLLENGARLAKPGAAQKPAGGVQGRRKAGILVATREAYALLDLAGGVKPARTAAPARAAVPLTGEFHFTPWPLENGKNK